jgi:hypothetical protein
VGQAVVEAQAPDVPELEDVFKRFYAHVDIDGAEEAAWSRPRRMSDAYMSSSFPSPEAPPAQDLAEQ